MSAPGGQAEKKRSQHGAISNGGNGQANFDHASGTGREDKFEIVSAAYRLRRSACFLKSSGAMLCTTCHNPHRVPRGTEAVAHYDRVCRECHST